MFRTKHSVFILTTLVLFIISSVAFASPEKITPQVEEKVCSIIESLHERYEE